MGLPAALIHHYFYSGGGGEEPELLSATIEDSDHDALVLVFASAATLTFGDWSLATLDSPFTVTVSGVLSGNGTTTVTLSLSRNVVAEEILTVSSSVASNVSVTNNVEYPTVDVTGINAFRLFGDSFTVGSNASNVATTAYGPLMQDVINATTYDNNAVSGRGAWQAIVQAHSATNLNDNSESLMSVMAGLNDIRRSGQNQKTYNKILMCHRAMAVAKFRSSYVPGSDAAVTRTGSHTTGVSYTTFGGKTTNGSRLTSAGTWQYTFTNTRIAIGLIGSDGVAANYGTFNVSIDGNQVLGNTSLNNWYDGISDGSNANTLGPVVFIFDGLTSAQHTITVTWVSGTVNFDFFANLGSPETRFPLMLFEIPFMLDYTDPVGLDNGSEAVSEEADRYIWQTFAQFAIQGYPITFVKLNEFYDLNTGCDVDLHHPNDTGHSQIATGALTYITGV